MRVATGMRDLHYVLHAPQGDTYADLLFTMIERRDHRPPVTYTTFQARDLGKDTAELFKTAARDAYDRFQPQAMIVGSSCTAELIQDDPHGLSLTMGLPCPVIPLELPSYSRKENWGASETFYQIVRTLADKERKPLPAVGENGPRRPRANLLGPTALGFRHRDDVAEITRLLGDLGIDVNLVAPMGSSPADIAGIGEADFNICLYPEIAAQACSWLERTFRQKTVKTVPIGLLATREFVSEVCAVAGLPVPTDLDQGRMGWWSRSIDSTYLTGKRVFIFGDGTHAVAAARVASEELGFKVVGLGCYNREFAREVRAAAEKYGVEPLISDDYLAVEEAIEAAAPELVLGTQMERHIAKRLRLPCAVISAPVHVQDFPARHSPQMGFEGAHVLFDTWVHEDFEFSDAAGPSHLGHASAPAAHAAPAAEQAESEVATITAPAAAPAEEGGWTSEALAELGKIPFFVRGKARRNTERYASEHGVTTITRDTLYEAKSHYAR
jgi:light-independent protochlorophyllide reductase subunit B